MKAQRWIVRVGLLCKRPILAGTERWYAFQIKYYFDISCQFPGWDRRPGYAWTWHPAWQALFL